MTDYAQYFLTEFTDLFKHLTQFCASNIKSERVQANIQQTMLVLDRLLYDKIATKYAQNNVLQQHLIFLNQNGFEKKCFVKMMDDKCWKIVPDMNLCLIFLHLEQEKRPELYNILYQLYSCACMYAKAMNNSNSQQLINQQRQNVVADGEFNPYEFIGGTDTENITIEEMFKNAQQRSYLPHEVLLGMMNGGLMDGDKIANEIENMDEVQLKTQTDSLVDTLNSDEYDKASADFLQRTIGKIYPKLVEMKNSGGTKGMNDKQSADMINNLARDLANEMMQETGRAGSAGGGIDPMKLFDSAQQLAGSKIDNPMFLGALGMLKSHILSQKTRLDKEIKNSKRNKRNNVTIPALPVADGKTTSSSSAKNQQQRMCDDEITNLLGKLD